MKNLGEYLQAKKDVQTQPRSPQHSANWQLMGEEVSNHFGKPLYWLFHRFPQDWIWATYKELKEAGERNPQALIRLLQWKKKQNPL